MSQIARSLSPALKALINAPSAFPNPVAASPKIRSVYNDIRNGATAQKLSPQSWIAISTAATITLNSPASLEILYKLAAEKENPVQTAEFMREVALKCIGFNGIPRTINNLTAFHSTLPASVREQLATSPSRTSDTLSAMKTRGSGLWDSIYHPHTEKLTSKLGLAHPDLPGHIINHNYGPLFSDPSSLPAGAKVGRVMTSLVGISCLRAQGGVAPQVVSHVFGLRKAFEEAELESSAKEAGEGWQWLCGDEGGVWVLEAVDSIITELGEGRSTFAKL